MRLLLFALVLLGSTANADIPWGDYQKSFNKFPSGFWGDNAEGFVRYDSTRSRDKDCRTVFPFPPHDSAVFVISACRNYNGQNRVRMGCFVDSNTFHVIELICSGGCKNFDDQNSLELTHDDFFPSMHAECT